MDPTQFAEDYPDEITTDFGQPTYVPDPLPPDISYTEELTQKLAEARGELGKLAGIGQSVGESRILLLRPFIRREAVYSSRIEGTYATVSAVYAHEAGEKGAVGGTDEHEVAEVFNYVRATQRGLEKIQEQDISGELLKQLHDILMTDVRGGEKQPGAFRDDLRAIGDEDPTKARFIPPAPHRVPYDIDELIDYINSDTGFDPLIDIALIHYQFETIHPFADGNGRMGRLLITLLVDQYDLLPAPFLYFSSYFNSHRDEYFNRLFDVNSKGAWQEWLTFFLNGVIDQSKEVYLRSEELLKLRSEYRETYQDSRSETVLTVVNELFRNPVITIKQAEEKADVTYRTARNAIQQLEQDDVLTEITGKKRYKVFQATEIVDVIEKPLDDLVDDADKAFYGYNSLTAEEDQSSLADF